MQSGERTERINEFTHLLPVSAEVDATIHRLGAKEFVTDPVVERRYSRITSIVSSAYKRHGAIIEKAFVAALKESPHLTVWAEPDFRVSAAGERLADGDATASGSAFSYLEDAYERVLQVDLLVFDSRNRKLGSYECKRGFGYHDSGKKRSMLRDLRCIQMLLKSYGEKRGLDVGRAEARIIFYYGTCSVGSRWALTREDLDSHFGAPVTEAVEAVNQYFRSRLNTLLASVEHAGVTVDHTADLVSEDR
jgi:hypothetical protein